MFESGTIPTRYNRGAARQGCTCPGGFLVVGLVQLGHGIGAAAGDFGSRGVRRARVGVLEQRAVPVAQRRRQAVCRRDEREAEAEMSLRPVKRPTAVAWLCLAAVVGCSSVSVPGTVAPSTSAAVRAEVPRGHGGGGRRSGRRAGLACVGASSSAAGWGGPFGGRATCGWGRVTRPAGWCGRWVPRTCQARCCGSRPGWRDEVTDLCERPDWADGRAGSFGTPLPEWGNVGAVPTAGRARLCQLHNGPVRDGIQGPIACPGPTWWRAFGTSGLVRLPTRGGANSSARPASA